MVAEAADGAQAVSLVAEHRPDVAVLDIQMPGMSGIEATRQIMAQYPAVRVLILTAYDDDPYIFALLHAGANGYILKTADSAELVRALRAVHRGESALDPAVTHKVVQQLTTVRPLEPSSNRKPGQAAAKPSSESVMIEALTDREVEVLRCRQGFDQQSHRPHAGISDRTVQGHLANIYGKLSVNSRTEAVTQAPSKAGLWSNKSDQMA